MPNTETAFEEVTSFWTEALSPATAVEKHLTLSIARQDYLMGVLLKSAANENSIAKFPKHLASHRDMAETLESLVRTLDTVQRLRLALEPPPSPSKAQRVRFPTRSGPWAVGRPQRVGIEPQPVPDIEPFSRFRARNERGANSSLDLKSAA